MSRIRTTKPDYWDDDIVGSISRNARLLFLATWNFADDEGLIRWAPDYLKGAVFRYDQDITAEDVAEWMREIEDAGFTYVYSTSRARQRIGFIVNFRKHQRIDKPQIAKMPVPNWRDPAVVMVYARRDGFVCRHCNDAVNEQFSADPALRRYDPVCERVKSPAERPSGPDDPSNIAVVHVMCAKDFDPDAARTPPKGTPGPFAERSQNVPGMVQERSSGPLGGFAEADATPSATNRGESALPPDAPGQNVPGTFHEHSATEGKGKEGIRERKGREAGAASVATADALFDAPAAPAADAAHRDEPEVTAHTLLGEWIKHRGEDRPSKNIIGRVGKQLAALIAEGINTADIRQGFVDWDFKGADPAALPSFVNSATARRRAQAAGRSSVPAQRPSTTTRIVDQGVELIRKMAEEDGVDLGTLIPVDFSQQRRELTA